MEISKTYVFWVILVLIIFFVTAYFYSIIPCKSEITKIYPNNIEKKESWFHFCSIKKIIQIERENRIKTDLALLPLDIQDLNISNSSQTEKSQNST